LLRCIIRIPAACGVTPAVYSRVSTAIDWIRRTACQLTTNASALTFPCPDLVCPIDTTVFGTPTAVLPRVASADTFHAWNGFRIARLTQYPLVGTKIPPNSVQQVRVFATDPSNRTLTCQWNVRVPPTTIIASFDFNVSQSAPQHSRGLSIPLDVSGNAFRIRTLLGNGTSRLRGGAKAFLFVVLNNNQAPAQRVVALRNNETVRNVQLVTAVPLTTDWKVTLRAVGVTNVKSVSVQVQLLGQKDVAP
jgi:hypothetical protein